MAAIYVALQLFHIVKKYYSGHFLNVNILKKKLKKNTFIYASASNCLYNRVRYVRNKFQVNQTEIVNNCLFGTIFFGPKKKIHM